MHGLQKMPSVHQRTPRKFMCSLFAVRAVAGTLLASWLVSRISECLDRPPKVLQSLANRGTAFNTVFAPVQFV
jgi:hypothetical protein